MEEHAYEHSRFDATLDLLERRLPGGRFEMRTALASALQPKLRRKGALETHSALLKLARFRDKSIRLVTTNFDHVFLKVIAREKLKIPIYAAPTLPIPKHSRWNGLVHLHGILPKAEERSALDRLVVTSGDFGLAYLTERWAARFVSELFRNYIVCFIGYSINDPVFRYMMDALAADRMLGEMTPQAYAFGDCEPGQEDKKDTEWKAKGVTPILYEVSPKAHDHSALHRTLKAWAETSNEGVQAIERIVVRSALARPSASTKQDDFVGRMLWALSHKSGLPAKRFAEHDPVPSLDWLQALGENRYGHHDLPRFGVPSHSTADKRLAYSLIRRPAPYIHAPWMMLVSSEPIVCEWDDVMFQLGRWLTRHLGDPTLILQFAQWGGHMHKRLAQQIEHELDRLTKLDTEKLERIRTNAPNGIPNAKLRVLWRLLLIGRVRTPGREFGLYEWKDRFARDGLTPSLRLQLRDMLSPMVKLTRAFRWMEEASGAKGSDDTDHVIYHELILSSDGVYSALSDLRKNQQWSKLLIWMIDDFQSLLRDALDLLRELGEGDERNDRSHFDLPSISDHWQNRGFRDWVSIIVLLRDAWLAVYEENASRAEQIAIGWFSNQYPTFKRLALFAAAQEGIFSAGEWVEWLTADEGWWLWSPGVLRETMRLLVLKSSALQPDTFARLESAILAGPPHSMHKDDLSEEDWNESVSHSKWLRLRKIASGGNELGPDARAVLDALSDAHPRWRVSEHEREEFPYWMSGTDDPDFQEFPQIEQAPQGWQNFLDWVQRPPHNEEKWREKCRERFLVCVRALRTLSYDDIWPKARWRVALQIWTEEGFSERSWNFISPVMQKMPDEVLLEILHSASWWIQASSQVLTDHEDIFFNLCHRILDFSHNDNFVDGDPLLRALNHPVGHITQALLDHWFRNKLSDNQGLPSNLKEIFTQICVSDGENYRHGRVLLASRLIALFRVDRDWTTKHLLPLFDWGSSHPEASSVWDGFLWSPRIYRPLLSAFKNNFLATAGHYTDLGEHKSQYAAFLTYVALDPLDTFTRTELHQAVAALPQNGLDDVAQALVQALEAAGEQREQYWSKRIKPFWEQVWPKNRKLVSSAIAENLARLAIAAGSDFPKALSAVRSWLLPVEHPHSIVYRLYESGHVSQFPEPSLCLLNTIISRPALVPTDLKKCLEEIAKAWPKAHQDSRYQRLDELSRR